MKYRYLIIHEDYSLFGTNDAELAGEAVEFDMVVDLETGVLLGGMEEREISEMESNYYSFEGEE